MVESAYTLGRPLQVMAAPFCGSDSSYGADRLDEKHLSNPIYSHCTFVNISFKKVTISGGKFENCVFIGCYFRRATLSNSSFVGCRFFGCNFSYIGLQSCDFRYSKFKDCYLPSAELNHSLPSEPNLREELARNLAIEAEAAGEYLEANRYRRLEIKAREQNWLAAVIGESQWYRDHYDFFARVVASVRLLTSLLNRWVWGYGQSSWVLVRNSLIVGFLVFPVLYRMFIDQLATVESERPTLVDLAMYSIDQIIPASHWSEVVATGGVARFISSVESLAGIVLITLFAAYIFRWSLRR